MGDFPWQRGETPTWDARMPWQRGADAPSPAPDAADPAPEPPEEVPGPEVDADPPAAPEPIGSDEPGDRLAPEPIAGEEPGAQPPADPDPSAEPRADAGGQPGAGADERRPAEAGQEEESRAGAEPSAAPARAGRRTGQAGRRTRTRGRGTGIVVALVVVGVIAAVAIPAVLSSDVFGEPDPLADVSEDDRRAAAEGMAAVASEFLTAIEARDADAARALVYGAEEFASDYQDASFLSAEMLDASQDLAPMTDVTIVESGLDGSAWSGRVRAEMLLAGEPHALDLEMTEGYDGAWRVDDYGLGLSLYDAAFDEFGVTIFGRDVDLERETMLFPGAYEVAVGAPHLVVGVDTPDGTERPDALVLPLAEDEWPTAALSAEAERTARQAFADAVEVCLASDAVRTPCASERGFAAGDVEGPVTRSSDTIADATAAPLRVDIEDPEAIAGFGYFSIRLDARCAGGGECTAYEVSDRAVVVIGDDGAASLEWRS
ncbi:hypothetical protein [Microbacterium excoecariae]|uniref:hypothetical protein n=1 Tax=Microbacterium excoecariae TaxID=2715210 RepID=UPI00140BAAD6|nr:hypothetical protein [Microbacterium excoecariae]NHI17102.1 hypothetical protein [Microbacterium excoecariae]